MTTDPSDALTSRRRLIIGGGIGAAAAAFLAACGTSSGAKSGLSGTPASTTLVAPTVPTTLPSATALEYDKTLLRTGASLELVVAAAYTAVGQKAAGAALKATIARIGADHTATADTFNKAIEKAADRITDPNAYVQDNVISPVIKDLQTDEAIQDFLKSLESMLAATYVVATGAFTTAAWRAQVSAFASAAARRDALLGNGGKGIDPTNALFDTSDLISASAYVPVESTTTTAGG